MTGISGDVFAVLISRLQTFGHSVCCLEIYQEATASVTALFLAVSVLALAAVVYLGDGDGDTDSVAGKVVREVNDDDQLKLCVRVMSWQASGCNYWLAPALYD